MGSSVERAAEEPGEKDGLGGHDAEVVARRVDGDVGAQRDPGEVGPGDGDRDDEAREGEREHHPDERKRGVGDEPEHAEQNPEEKVDHDETDPGAHDKARRAVSGAARIPPEQAEGGNAPHDGDARISDAHALFARRRRHGGGSEVGSLKIYSAGDKKSGSHLVQSFVQWGLCRNVDGGFKKDN